MHSDGSIGSQFVLAAGAEAGRSAKTRTAITTGMPNDRRLNEPLRAKIELPSLCKPERIPTRRTLSPIARLHGECLPSVRARVTVRSSGIGEERLVGDLPRRNAMSRVVRRLLCGCAVVLVAA